MKKIKCCEKSYIFSKIFAIISICLCFSLIFTNCGGGGGGAGGASIPASEYTTHNAGGWGGGGNSGGANGGSGGNGVNTTGGTPLVIDHYFYNQNYASTEINNLIAVIQNDGSITNTVITVDFYVAGESTPRQARVTKGNTKVEKFEHQYKATCTNTQTSSTFTRYFYHDSGLDLSAETTTPNMQWQCAQNGVTYGNFINGIQGDITLSTVFGTPNCDINLTSPSPNASNIYEISNLNESFTFGIAMNGGGDFPDGTTFAWQVPGNTPFSGTSGTITKTIAEYGLSENSLGTNTSNASDLIILCTVSIPGEPQFIKSKTIKVFKKVTLPAITVSLDSKPSTAGSSLPYKVYDPSSDQFIFKAQRQDGVANFPANTTFSWKINGTPVTANPATPDRITVPTAILSGISSDSSLATTLNVECEIDHVDKINSTQTTSNNSNSVYQVTIPPITIGMTGLSTTHPTTSDGAYRLGPCDMTKTFIFNANGTNIPDDAVYTWEVVENGAQLASGTDIQQITPTIKAMRNNNDNVPTSTETLTIKCTVSHPNLPASYNQENTATVKFAPPQAFPTTPTASEPAANFTLDYDIANDVIQVHSFNWNDTFTVTINTAGLPSDCNYRWTDIPVAGSNDTTTITNNTGSIDVTIKDFYTTGDTPKTTFGDTTGTIYCYVSAPGCSESSRIDIPFHFTYNPKFGSKSSANALGDIVFSDGSASPYTNFTSEHPMIDELKNAAVAVIFYTGSDGICLTDGRTLGVGLQQEGKQWAVVGSAGYSFVNNDGNGAENTAKIKNLSDYGDGTNYPAFSWADEYRNTQQTYFSGWFIPDTFEMAELSSVRNTVNFALTLLGATNIADNAYYWTSTEVDGAFPNNAYIIQTVGGSSQTDGSKSVNHTICAVHEF